MNEEVLARMEAVKEGTATPIELLQEVARVKSEELVSQWDNHRGKNLEGVLTLATPQGEASIGDIQYFAGDGDRGVDGVEVWIGPNEGGAPTYRLINPPIMVADPTGAIVLPMDGTKRVRRYRVDPLAAIAEFIASHSGKAETG